MKLRIILVGAVAILFSGLQSLSAAEVIRYAGATTVQNGYMKAAAPVFQKKKDVEFKLFGGNTGPGMKVLAKGDVELGGGGRFLKKEEQALGLVPVHVGWDALIPIVNAGNPVNSLTSAQLKGMFSGEIKNWKQVGGADEPVVLFTAPKDSAIRDLQQELILGGGGFAPHERVLQVPAKAVPFVAEMKGGIGVTSKIHITSQPTDKIKTIKLNGVSASSGTISQGKYKLVMPLILVTKGPATGTVKEFIDFTMSKEGQKIMDQVHFAVK